MYESSKIKIKKKTIGKRELVTSLIYRLPFKHYQVTNLAELFVLNVLFFWSQVSQNPVSISLSRECCVCYPWCPWCYIYGRMAGYD